MLGMVTRIELSRRFFPRQARRRECRPVALALVGSVLGMLGVSGARAAELSVVSIERRLVVDSSVTDPVEETTTAADGLTYKKTLRFEHAERQEGSLLGNLSGSALMDSRVTPSEIFARGHGMAFASGDPELLESVAISHFLIEFDVDVAIPFLLEGRVLLSPRGGDDMLNSLGLVRFSGPDGVIHETVMDGSTFEAESGEVRFFGDAGITGELAPGRYTLEGYAEGSGEGSLGRCVDYELRFSLGRSPEVPEPSAAGLGAAGLLCWLGNLRRRRLTSAVPM